MFVCLFLFLTLIKMTPKETQLIFYKLYFSYIFYPIAHIYVDDNSRDVCGRSGRWDEGGGGVLRSFFFCIGDGQVDR